VNDERFVAAGVPKDVATDKKRVSAMVAWRMERGFNRLPRGCIPHGATGLRSARSRRHDLQDPQ
jgi:hypothetical protein